jgi:hypothetical protein
MSLEVSIEIDSSALNVSGDDGVKGNSGSAEHVEPYLQTVESAHNWYRPCFTTEMRC